MRTTGNMTNHFSHLIILSHPINTYQIEVLVGLINRYHPEQPNYQSALLLDTRTDDY